MICNNALYHKLFLELDAFDIQHKGGKPSIMEDWTETGERSRINRQAELFTSQMILRRKFPLRTKCISCAMAVIKRRKERKK